MYPDNPAFQEALRQARERAESFARARHQQQQQQQQAQAPDPPESGTTKGKGKKAAKDRRGNAASLQPPPPQQRPQLDSVAAVAVERNAAAAAAAAQYHHLRLGTTRHTPGTSSASNLMHQLHLSDLHKRIVFERQQERAAFLAASRVRGELPPPPIGLAAPAAAGRPAWASHGTVGMAAAGPASYDHQLQAEIEAENRWRVQQGLPPLNFGGAGGRAALPPVGLGRAGSLLAGAHLPTHTGSDTGSPALRGLTAGYSVGELVASRASGDAPETEGEAGDAGGAEGAERATQQQDSQKKTGNALFDLLATAAEDTLRREELQYKSKDNDDEQQSNNENGSSGVDPPSIRGMNSVGPPDAIRAAVDSSTPGAASLKPIKRKRKTANEPKNPLGAFVFYQRKIMADVFEENPCITFGEAAAECGKRWRALPEEQKQEYKEMAAADKARYTRELATFKTKHDEEPVPEMPKPVLKKPGRGRPKKQDGGAAKTRRDPKRPRSAFLFYKAEEMPKVFREFPHVTKGEAATECAARYKTIPKAEKNKYEEMAANDKIRYQKELATSKRESAENSTIPWTQARRSQQGEKAEALDQFTDTSEHNEGELDRDDEAMDKVIDGWSPEAVQVPKQQTYDAMVDHNSYYVEEEALRYHNPPLPSSGESGKTESTDIVQFTYVSHEDLRPLPPPPPLPSTFPNTPYCRWSFDEDSRVLYADFRRTEGDAVVTLEDEKFLLEMYERDDITVISEGLVSGLDKEKWTLDYLGRVAGEEYYHKFRRFEKLLPEENSNLKQKKATKGSNSQKSNAGADEEEFLGVVHGEIDKCLSMKVKDYITYLRRRSVALAAALSSDQGDQEGLCNFTFIDHDETKHTIDVTKAVLYMIDFDMVKLLPTLNADFVSNFKLKGALPGGSHCMMNCVTSNGRPFMGPNLYITPPGSFTHFHQDGHGTVDSGHVCLSGYNEVVILRRLPERHKRHALRFLTGSYKNSRERPFEALYNLPHGDGLGEKPIWPDTEAIDKCTEMNYCVSRFILKEGQHVHINKGRLHAFRKLSNEPLPPTDCHAELRANLVKPGTSEKVVGPGKPEILCISVAWDWMFRGVTAKGINREIVSSLECAALNRKYGVLSLAIPELSLIQMARTLAPKPDEKTAPPGAYRESMIGFELPAIDEGQNYKGFMPSPSVICKGIFPALQYVVKQHIYAMNVAESLKSKSFERCKRVSVAKRPNTSENPVCFALDPYGNSDFFCKLCSKELSNVYLHCDGCELLLSKDFNICLECHQEKRYQTSVQMHPLNNKRHSTINHIGNFTFDRSSRCPCKNGPACKTCNYCAGCSCRCHTWFTLHFRFFKKDDELKLLHRVKRKVGREELEAAEEAEKRLSMAVKGYFDDRERTPFGLHGMDVMVESHFDDEGEDVDEETEEESDHSDSSQGERKRPEPTRKSRRLSQPELVSPEQNSGVDGSEPKNGDKDKRSSKDAMEVDVDDMRVTIRYRSGDWSEDERRTLRKALREESDWKDIVARLPDRGSHQIRTYALKNFPSLSKSLRDRGVDHMMLDAPGADEDQQGEKSSFSDSVPGTSQDNHETAILPVARKVKIEDTDEKKSESDREEEAKTAGAQSPTVAKKPPQANTGRWSDEEKERLKEALENEPDLESVEKFVGTRRIPQIRSYADRTFPELFQSFRERMAGMDKDKVKWADEEKERLRVALENEPDFESVEKFVGTRRIQHIRAFAPRVFPELWQALADRMSGVQRVKVKIEPEDDSQEESQSATEDQNIKVEEVQETQDEPQQKKLVSRRSSRRSTRNQSSEVSAGVAIKADPDGESKSDDEKANKATDRAENGSEDGSTSDEEEDEGNEPAKQNKVAASKPSKPNPRANQIEGGRSRRLTQDLSGGRKRRNSHPTKQAGPPAKSMAKNSKESESETSSEELSDEISSKRQKMD